jgi:hypothetical protein
MNLGQLLGGAGVVGQGWRAEEDAQRRSRQVQLQTDEMNRLDRLRQEMLGAPMPAAQVPQFGIGDPMGVRYIEPPAAPVAPGAPAPVVPAQARFGAPNQSDPESARLARSGLVMGERPYQDVAGYTPPAGMTGPQNMALLQQERLRRFAAPEVARPEMAGMTEQERFAELQRLNAPTGRGDMARLYAAVEKIESGGRADAVSPKGARGPMQTMPGTLTDPGFGVRPAQNNSTEELRRVGQDYLMAMLRKYNGNLDHALAAYNWGPTNADKWITAGADPAKLPKETRGYIPKVKAELGMATTPAPADTAATPAATAAPQETPRIEVSGTSEFYLANPQSIPLDMQRAMQQRGEIERLAGMYQRAGMGMQFMETRAKLMEVDNSMTYLQGMQGLQEFTLANDPRRLAAVWSQYAGVPVGIQPRTDGKFDIVVNGKRTKEGVSASEISDSARSAFDQTYRQQKGAASAKYNEEQFKAQLDMQKENAKQLSQMIREVAVQRVQGNTQLAIEQLKQFRYDVKPTGAGDGTVVITPPGSGTPYLFNPSGRTIEIDGVKITANSAYPIAGLPSYGGVQTR